MLSLVFITAACTSNETRTGESYDSSGVIVPGNSSQNDPMRGNMDTMSGSGSMADTMGLNRQGMDTSGINRQMTDTSRRNY